MILEINETIYPEFHPREMIAEMVGVCQERMQSGQSIKKMYRMNLIGPANLCYIVETLY